MYGVIKRFVLGEILLILWFIFGIVLKGNFLSRCIEVLRKDSVYVILLVVFVGVFLIFLMIICVNFEWVLLIVFISIVRVVLWVFGFIDSFLEECLSCKRVLVILEGEIGVYVVMVLFVFGEIVSRVLVDKISFCKKCDD